MHLSGHHKGLTVGINGRISDLGKSLCEVVIQHVRPLGKDSKRLVITHAPSWLLACGSHGLNHHLNVLNGVALVELPLDQVLLDGTHLFVVVVCFQECRGLDLVTELLDPVKVRFPHSHGFLDVVILNKTAIAKVNRNHLAWTQSALGLDSLSLLLFFAKHTNLAADDRGAVVQPPVSRWTEAVAVQCCTHVGAIAICNQSRPIPWLLKCSPVLIEVHDRVIVWQHSLVVLVCLWHHCHQRLRQLPVAPEHKLKITIEVAGVAVARTAWW
mmetsp:Transcript_49864/g.116541  ORF Transcript_49864/g.116541 Transcript_49864/m.116541 type:complete len:270 (+) Transcript_49864:3312-4121(+)